MWGAIALGLTILTFSAGQRIFTSVPISIESSEYRFPGNSHGCGHIRSNSTSELTIDMSENSCGGGTIQCPRCFFLHHGISLTIKSCQSPPRTSKCQETGQCPTMDPFDIGHRLNEYLFINLSDQDPIFVGSDSAHVAIGPNSARSGLCYQGVFYWP